MNGVVVKFLGGRYRVRVRKGHYREVETSDRAIRITDDLNTPAVLADAWRACEEAARNGTGPPFNGYGDEVRWWLLGQTKSWDPTVVAVARDMLRRYCGTVDGTTYLLTDKGIASQNEVFRPQRLPLADPFPNSTPLMWYPYSFLGKMT